MLLFILWAGMILFSLVVGVKNSVGCQVQAYINFSRSGVFDYIFGLHHTALISQDNKGNRFRIEKLSIGIILFTMEVAFYKRLPAGPSLKEQ